MEHIENTKEIATKIFNHSIKAKKEIENYTRKMKEIRNNLNEDTKNLSYSLSQELEIDYKILLQGVKMTKEEEKEFIEFLQNMTNDEFDKMTKSVEKEIFTKEFYEELNNKEDK